MKKFKAYLFAFPVLVIAAGLLLSFQNCSRIRVVDPGQADLSSKDQGAGVGSGSADTLQPSSPSSDGIDLSVSPPVIDFGKLPLNTSSSQDLVISNMGKNDLRISLPQQAGRFLIDASQCGQLKTMQSCKVKVSYSPPDNILQRQQITVKATAVNDGREEQAVVSVKAEGFFLPPSVQDQLALVGWYSYKQPTKIAFNNAPGSVNSLCPSVVASNGHGQMAEFCYEPSGAHGLYSGDSQVGFSTLTNYILQAGSSFSSVSTLDQLFPTPEDLKSDNVCFQEGLFYYALSYLIVPASLNSEDSSWDVRFSFSNVDDGLQLISNGYKAGYATLGQGAQFSLRTISQSGGGSVQALRTGANTIVALWVDDCRVDRYITNAKAQFKTLNQANYQTFEPLTPNVVRGYIYDKINGQAISGALVRVVDSSNTVQTVNTDASGFYQLTGIKDGGSAITISAAGKNTLVETVVTDHKQASTAIVDFSRGL